MKKKFFALVTAAALLLGGCASGGQQQDNAGSDVVRPLTELVPLANPAAEYQKPASAVLQQYRIEPFVTDPQPKLPATVTSHAFSGAKQVTVDDVSRIIPLSLGGSVGDYVYSLGFGKQIVGRDISTEIPELGEVPVVTRGGHNIDAESVLALNPSLIITDGTIGPTDVIDQLADAGVKVVYVEQASNYEQSYKQAQQIADALGVSDKAPALIEKLRADIAAKEQEIAGWIADKVTVRPRVAFLYMRGKGVFYLFGEGSGIDTLFASLGVTDVAKEIGWKGQRPMNDEALIKANPDTLLVMTKGLKSVNGVDGMLTVHPATALTAAGKAKRVIDINDTSLFVGASRVPYVLDALARALYAPNSLQN